MHRHILIPTDGSDLSAEAIEYGIALAKAVGAKVTALTVTNRLAADSPAVSNGRSSAEARVAGHLAQIASTAAEAKVSCDIVQVEHQHPYRAIIDTALSKGCDLIVMASHGRRGLPAVVLGSETVKVLTHSAIPVLVYRRSHSALFPSYFAAS
jgi:nucleotide-binding universal stress UspA family protein